MSAGGVLSAVFWGVVTLSLLVFVHEGGHYLAARAFGVRVTEFFLGMPCRARLSRKLERYGTEVGVTPILLGGYTRICGMEGEQDELLAQAFAVVQREGRVSAAAVASELGCDVDRSYDLLATLTDWAAIRPFYDASKGERPSQGTYPEQFETLRRDPAFLTEYDRAHDFSLPGTTAAGEARPLDCGADEALARERSHTYLGCGFWKRFWMLFAGPLVNVALAFVLAVGAFCVMGQQVVVDSNVIASVTEGSLADQAGLQAGDAITRVGDVEVSDWSDLVDAVRQGVTPGSSVEVDYVRDGEQRATTIEVPEGEGQLLGVNAQTTTYHPGVLEASRWAVSYAGLVASFAVRLIVPTQTMQVLDSSTSIVGISVMASEAASQGPMSVVSLLAAISMSLGFMNLLPIPPLDGGKILIEVIQAAIRRPLSVRAQSVVSYVGLAFFAFVFVVVLKNDVSRLLIG